MNRNLSELKPRLTHHLICSISCIEVVYIHGSLRYTGHFSGLDLGLVGNCLHGSNNYVFWISTPHPSGVNKVELVSKPCLGADHYGTID